MARVVMLRASRRAYPVLFVVATLFSLVSGSHFRYGTLSYRPLDLLSDPEDDYNGMQNVEIRFNAAFRRDYKWGRFFNEEYKQTRDASGSDYGGEDAWHSYADVESPSSACSTTDYWTTLEENEEAGTSEGQADNLCYTTNPLYDDPNDSAGSEDTGYVAAEGDENYDNTPGERFYVRFPPFSGQLHTLEGKENETVTVCPGPFYCDWVKPDTNDEVIYSQCTDGTRNCSAPDCYNDLPCYDDTWNPSKCGLDDTDYETYYKNDDPNGEKECASWDDTYGFYIINPDGTFDSRTVTLTVTDIDYSCQPLTQPGPGDGECNSITGNWIYGEEYAQKKFQRNTTTPYTAYFTGGKRIYECQYDTSKGYNGLDSEGVCSSGGLTRLLQNNAEGLYRLELEIWILGDGNTSPVVYQVPTVPVPRSQLDTRSLLQIPAYDLEDDVMVFRFGTSREMGGMTRSKMCQYPYLDGEKDTSFNQYGDLRCLESTRTFQTNGTCPSDRTPRTIWGTEEHSFTSDVPGLVEWNTYYDNDEPLAFGLYNMVVMVHDLPQQDELAFYEERTKEFDHKVYDAHFKSYFTYKTKSPLDYMLYLYDGPMGFCNKACKDNKDINIEASLNGLTNNAYDLHANEEDPGLYPGYETFADPDGIYGITEPYWRSVYAEETLYGTNPDTDVPYGPNNSSAFSQNGYPIENYTSPYTGMDAAIVRMSQKCTVCGYGDSGLDNSMCTPFTDDNICGTTDQSGNLVPTEDACKENMRPTFIDEDVEGQLRINPEVHYWSEAVAHVESISDNIPYHNQATVHASVEGEYKIGNITVYKGETVEFIVVAYDTDDCTELTLTHTGLQQVKPEYVNDDLITGYSAEFTDLQVLSDYPEFPEGMKIRKTYQWKAPERSYLSDEYDIRDEKTTVCFYAYDKYLLTNRPFYCVLIIIEKEPVIIEELKECYCRTCSVPGYVGAYGEREPTPNYAPRTTEYQALM